MKIVSPRGRVTGLLTGLAALGIVMSAMIGAPPSPARGASVCTGWLSELAPPPTIRVLRTAGPAVGTVQTVAFRDYVNVVMAAEWAAWNPREALQAGAVAVKEYAWYYSIYWRGKTAPDGSCYDVVDSTIDQVYSPETRVPAQVMIDAVDATWNVTLRRAGHLFLTHYQDGASADCGLNADGTWLYQTSAIACALAGMKADTILHTYYDPGLEVAHPGTGDVTGDSIGDILVFTPGLDPTGADTRLYPGALVPVGGVLPIPQAYSPLTTLTMFRQRVDVNGDGLDDLVVLVGNGDGTMTLWVAAATGGALGPATPWWTGSPLDIGYTQTGGIRFVAGDFDGDGLGDAMLLVGQPVVAAPQPIPTPSTGPGGSPAPSADPTPGVPVMSTAWLLRSTGVLFDPPLPWWTGPADINSSRAFAGDADGDDRADVILQLDLTRQQPPASTGLRYVVIRSGGLFGQPLEQWLDLPDTTAAQARTVVADVNSDGRTDLVVDRIAGTVGSQMLGLMSNGGAFSPVSLWVNSRTFRWKASRFAAADVDADGRTDIVVLYNAGAAGTKVFRFLSTGTRLRSAGATLDPGLTWSLAAPY